MSAVGEKGDRGGERENFGKPLSIGIGIFKWCFNHRVARLLSHRMTFYFFVLNSILLQPPSEVKTLKLLPLMLKSGSRMKSFNFENKLF